MQPAARSDGAASIKLSKIALHFRCSKAQVLLGVDGYQCFELPTSLSHAPPGRLPR